MIRRIARFLSNCILYQSSRRLRIFYNNPRPLFVSLLVSAFLEQVAHVRALALPLSFSLSFSFTHSFFLFLSLALVGTLRATRLSPSLLILILLKSIGLPLFRLRLQSYKYSSCLSHWQFCACFEFYDFRLISVMDD